MTAASPFSRCPRPGTSRFLLATLFLIGSCTPPPSSVDLAFVDVAVVDVEAGSVLPNRAVLIRGHRIVGIGSAEDTPIPASATVVSATGKYLIPGLRDMHVHALFDESVADRVLGLLLANGVTGVRDMGGLLDLSLTTRERLRRGDLLGPEIVISGPILDGPGSPHPEVSWILATPEDAARAVDSLVSARVDFLKVYTMLPRDAFHEIVERARAAGIPFAGHAVVRNGELLDRSELDELLGDQGE